MNENKLKAFVFDFDGTLADSVPVITATAALAYEEFNIPVTREQIIAHIGLPLSEASEEYVGEGNGQAFAKAYSRYYENTKNALRPFPGAAHLLESLHKAGAAIAVCTSKRRRSITESLEQTGLRTYLDTIVDFDSTSEHKPLPGPALLAAEQLGVAPAQCMFIGDARYDVECGRNAGMRTCAVTWGAGTLAELLEAKPDHLVFSMAELEQLLLSLC